MRTFTRVILLLLVSFLIAACSSSNGTADDAATTTTAVPAATVAAPETATTAATTTTEAATTTAPQTALAVTGPMEMQLELDMTDAGFDITGEAVDAGAICPEGMLATYTFATVDGEQVPEEEWFEAFDAAVRDRTVAEMVTTMKFNCAYGAGSFVMEEHTVFDFSIISMDSGGQDLVGTWEIFEGTGANEGVTGTGDVIGDWDSGVYLYPGEVETG